MVMAQTSKTGTVIQCEPAGKLRKFSYEHGARGSGKLTSLEPSREVQLRALFGLTELSFHEAFHAYTRDQAGILSGKVS